MREAPMPTCSFLALIALSAPLAYHVDVNGIPPGSGTQGDPWTSIQTALDESGFASGDTILGPSGESIVRLRITPDAERSVDAMVAEARGQQAPARSFLRFS
jgi:hypothetical protein